MYSAAAVVVEQRPRGRRSEGVVLDRARAFLVSLRTPRRLAWVSMSLAAFGALLWFGAAARHVVDGHHQGWMARTAVDLIHGRSLYTETYSVYAPLHSYLNAVALVVFGERLVSLQYLAVIGYGLASALLWRFWNIVGGPVAAWMGVVAMWLSAPEVMRNRALHEAGEPSWAAEPSVQPWSSVWVLVLAAIAFTAFINALRLPHGQTRSAVTAGVAAGLMIGTRTTSGIAAVVGFVVASAAWNLLTGERVRRVMALACAGALGGAVITYGPTIFVGGIDDAWDQTVVLPREYFKGILWPSVGLALEYLRDALPFAIAVTALVIGATVLDRRTSDRRARRGGAVVLVLGLVGAARLSIGAWPLPDEVLRAQGHWKSAVLSLTLVAIGGGVVVGVQALRLRHSVPKGHDRSRAVLLVGAILGSTCLVQLVPVVEQRHIWWSSVPLLGVGFAALLRPMRRTRWIAVSVVVLAFVPLIVAGGLGYHARQTGSWVPLAGSPFLSGMTVRPEFAAEVRPLLEVVESVRQERPEVAVVALGHDVLYGLLGGSRAAPNRYSTVTLLFNDPPSLARFIKQERPILWLEASPRDLVEPWAASIGYCVAALHDPNVELPLLRTVLVPCPGPAPNGPLRWRAADGIAPPWAEDIV